MDVRSADGSRVGQASHSHRKKSVGRTSAHLKKKWVGEGPDQRNYDWRGTVKE